MTSVTLIRGDARRIPLADKSVQCVVTSPPYYGLRDYQTARWDGGDGACEHRESGTNRGTREELPNPPAGWAERACGTPYRDTCGKCGARRVDAQIGLEASVQDYVATMVQVFREVKRVLRDDGTVWCNLGDAYSSSPSGFAGTESAFGHASNHDGAKGYGRKDRSNIGLPPKNLLGIPWRIAFALQADGWVLRSDIIWSKPNPMPESVTDRPTKSHEYVFLLAKRERYFYDQEACREEALNTGNGTGWGRRGDAARDPSTRTDLPTWDGPKPVWSGRNLRSVWTITPRPFAGAHFATFPAELVRRCIAAGTSERGQCPTCGAAWRRVVDTPFLGDGNPNPYEERLAKGNKMRMSGAQLAAWKADHPSQDRGWQPGCTCPPHEPVPQVVLDVFGGAGTVPLVASNMGRRGVMVELSAKYVAMARRRISRPHARHERPERAEDLPLFAGLD